MTLDDARPIAAPFPRSYGPLVRDEVRFRVATMVYAAFYDDTIMGFGFPEEEREAFVGSEPTSSSCRASPTCATGGVYTVFDAIDVDELRELLIDAWRMCVPKTIATDYKG